MPRGISGGRQHGTRSMYTAGCRLDCCRNASTKAQKERRLREQTGPLLLPAVGVLRRLNALRAIGWPMQDIAKELGVTMGALSSLLYKDRDQTRVTRTLYERVLAAYDRMSPTPGPSDMARARALKAGYAPPLAWDDDTIDDPSAEPVGVRTGRGRGEREFDLDEWFWLVRTGELPERAAERCGVKLGSVDWRARRHGRGAEFVAAMERSRERHVA